MQKNMVFVKKKAFNKKSKGRKFYAPIKKNIYLQPFFSKINY